MRIGMHMRTSTGLEKTVLRAVEIGCETIQIFASNPSAWKPGILDAGKAEKFRQLANEHDITPVVIHTPYLLNLASPDPEIHGKSLTALSEALRRADLLGASFVVTHIGSHRGEGVEKGIEKVFQGISSVLDAGDFQTRLLLENSAGSGDSVGSKFEDLGAIVERLSDYVHRIGICLDTAHLWGAGYDISSQEAVDRTIGEFESVVGIQWLYVMHMNDTNVHLGSRRDRHANIGTGAIGEAGFSALVNHPAIVPLAGIIETPPQPQGSPESDMEILKRLRLE